MPNIVRVVQDLHDPPEGMILDDHAAKGRRRQHLRLMQAEQQWYEALCFSTNVRLTADR